MGIIKLDDPSRPNIAGNSLPNHSEKGANAVAEGGCKRIKADVMEVRTPIKCVWEQIVCRGLITRDLDERPKGAGTYSEFHTNEGHNIQECAEFRTMVQNLMNNKEIEFYEEINGFEEIEVCASNEGHVETFQKVNHPVVIISQPRSNEAWIQIPPKVIIQKPVPFSYKDNKRVPWNYDCNVTTPREGNPINALEENNYDGFYTRIRKCYDPTRALPRKGLGKYLQWKVEVPRLMDKRDRFGLGYKPNAKQNRKELEKKRERRKARLDGEEIKEEILGNLSINAICEEDVEEGNSSSIRPYESGSILNNWTAEEISVTFKVNSE
ncbi:hypothetical protein Gotri_028167 [Gossypium trilobum]|uniref:Uncharacterized protein n=1 Tax=Gossypium trilobum TaxID=34281 RepID=A0A7J9FT69_9ROSI|nr:hypothetical protein [Gossypium trilobum]